MCSTSNLLKPDGLKNDNAANFWTLDKGVINTRVVLTAIQHQKVAQGF
jgi:hypothetical protein